MARIEKIYKVFLTAHFIALALWLGGVASCLPILFRTNPDDIAQMRSLYLHLTWIVHNVVGWGGMGGLITGIVLAIWPGKRFYKQHWVLLKFILVIALILFGMFFNDKQIIANFHALNHYANSIMNDTQISARHVGLKKGLVLSIIGFVTVIWVATYKPFRKIR